MTDQATPETPQEGSEQESQSGFQKRINALVRERSDAQRETEEFKSRLVAAEKQLEMQQGLLAQRLEAPARPDTEFADLFGSSQTTRSTRGKNLPTEDFNSAIVQKVESLLTPIVQRLDAQEQKTQMSKQHVAAFNEVSQFFPELREPGSTMQVAFDEVWNNIPDIQKLPNGPALAGFAAAGLLQQESRAVQQDARKIAASGPVPTGDFSGRLDALPTDQQKKDENLVKNLHQKGQTNEGLDQMELGDLIGVKLGIRHAKE